MRPLENEEKKSLMEWSATAKCGDSRRGASWLGARLTRLTLVLETFFYLKVADVQTQNRSDR